MRLLDTAVLPVLQWGLETVPATQSVGKPWAAMQRKCAGRMISTRRMPEEPDETFFRRRERQISAAIRDHASGKWSELQVFCFFTIQGHMVRLAPSHWAAHAMQWRSLEWCSRLAGPLPASHRGHVGRRPEGRGQPHLHSRVITQAGRNFNEVPAIVAGLGCLTGAVMARTWRELAQSRNAFRLFARSPTFRKH